MRADDDNGEELDRLLRRRPGWSLQALPTPGSPLAWCFGSGGTIELSVTTDGGSIDVYVVDSGENVTLSNTDQLIGWLSTHKAEALQEPREGASHGGKLRSFFRWD